MSPTMHNAGPPPIVQPNRGRIMALIGAGLLVAGLLLIVVFNIDRSPDRSALQKSADIDPITPTQITEEDLAGNMNSMGRTLHELGAENTWIQTTKNGKLAQQYRFASHDPNPEGLSPGWSRVSQPEIQLYLSDNRVLTMSSDNALLQVRAQTLESGQMTGNVTIRFYRIESGQGFDPATLTPTIEAHTGDAVFDNLQGEVRCDGSVDVQTPMLHLPGEQLRVQLNDVENRLESLRLKKVHAIRMKAQGTVDRTTSAKSPPRQTPNDTTGRTRPESEPPTFYRLSLLEDVHIQQGDAETGWSASGHRLNLIFSARSSSLGDSLAQRHSPMKETGVARYGALSLALVGASVTPNSTTGSAAGSLFRPADDDIIITCRGGLTMAPLGEDEDAPAASNDARMELVGSPIRLISRTDRATVMGHVFSYHTLNEHIRVAGSREFPLTFESTEMNGEAEAFWLNRKNGTGGFDGAGWLAMQRERKDGPTEQEPPSLRVQWLDRVSLQFEDNSDSTEQPFQNLKLTEFHGNVEVSSDEIAMRADQVTVRFADTKSGNAADDRRVESAIALGNVHAISLTDAGTLSCNALDLRFATSPSGRTMPLRMVATGEVAAVDPDHQTIWSDQLEIAFDTSQDVPADVARTLPREGEYENAAVKSLLASGNVQALMNDGVRVFADQLTADALSGVAVLSGDGNDVMIISDQGVIHRGKSLVLNKTQNTAQWPGAGEFVHFTKPLITNDGQRILRPDIAAIDSASNALQIRATWTDSLTFDGAAHDGAGELLVRGSVKAESWQNPLEHNTLASEALTMQFARSAVVEAVAGQEQPDLATSRRALKLLIAEGNAQIESRTWQTHDRSDRPRVFYVAGPHITYDDQSLEAHVRGEGELLVRDDVVIDQNKDESTPFSGKGTTLFRWNDRLSMTRTAGTMFTIDMIGAVSVQHVAVDRTVSTMTGNELHATVDRMAANLQAERPGGFDLGGSMELRMLRANGNVYVHTPTRDVDAETLEYDYASGLATMSARPGLNVTVKTTGNPNPFRANRVTWNIVEDKITAAGVRGTTPR